MVLKRSLARTSIYLFLILMLAVTFYPFFLMVQTSFKDLYQFRKNPAGFALPLHIENYPVAFQAIWRSTLNSIVVSGTTAVATVFVASLAAYGFSRYEFPLKNVLFYAIIILLMVPAVLMLSSRFILVKQFGLIDTWFALILPYIAGGQLLLVMLIKSYMDGIPRSLFESAIIDGAHAYYIYLRIAIPLTIPILLTCTIIHFNFAWNDLIWPMLTIHRRELKTLVVVLWTNFQTEFSLDMGGLMSGYVIGSIPMILIMMSSMKYFIRGMTAGALKV